MKKEFSNVEQIDTAPGMSVNDLVKQMSRSGVMGAGRLAKATDIAEAMIKDKDCKVFFGFAGAMVPGGMKNIVIDMLEKGWIDVFVSTGANLTHDLIESLGYHHLQGYADANDEELHKLRLDRIYDAFMPDNVYEGLEDFSRKAFADMPKTEMSIKEFLWEIGKRVEKKSILKTCYEKKIPIFCPAIADSGIGLQVWSYIQKNKLNVSAFEDLKEILDIAWSCKKAGVIYIGGGVPKNYIQQALQFSKGASYSVQITMDRPEPGGSSGAEPKEGISWGKLNKNALHSNLICDATIALPVIHAALKDRIK